MIHRIAANLVVSVHLLFIIYVVIGGLLVWRWPRTMWLHIPAATWGAVIEFAGWICPLTPLENQLRGLAGQAGYAGGFVEHYLVPLIYPGTLTDAMRWALGGGVVLVNVLAYSVYFSRLRRNGNLHE